LADEEHLIDAPEDEEPWTLLFEVAEATPEDSWVLVGGLMVHVHALRAGVVPSRPTRDVDLLLNLGAASVGDIAAPLLQLGFRPLDGSSELHRFTRDEDIIDVMVARGVSARWGRRPIFHAPAAAQALERRDTYVLQGSTRTVRIGVPDALGALVAKGAAYREDQRDRERHLEDLAVLAASAGPVRKLGLDRLTKRDKQHLRPAIAHLVDDQHAAWFVLDDHDRVIGHRVIAAIAEQL